MGRNGFIPDLGSVQICRDPVLALRLIASTSFQIFQKSSSLFAATWSRLNHHPNAPWCWNIYLQNWAILGVNVGKSSFLTGKSTIHGPFSIVMLNYQRVNAGKYSSTMVRIWVSGAFWNCQLISNPSSPVSTVSSRVNSDRVLDGILIETTGLADPGAMIFVMKRADLDFFMEV